MKSDTYSWLPTASAVESDRLPLESGDERERESLIPPTCATRALPRPTRLSEKRTDSGVELTREPGFHES